MREFVFKLFSTLCCFSVGSFCGIQLLFGWEFWRVELRHCLSVHGLFHYLEGGDTRGFPACMIAGSSLVIGVEGDEMTPG